MIYLAVAEGQREPLLAMMIQWLQQAIDSTSTFFASLNETIYLLQEFFRSTIAKDLLPFGLMSILSFLIAFYVARVLIGASNE